MAHNTVKDYRVVPGTLEDSWPFGYQLPSKNDGLRACVKVRRDCASKKPCHAGQLSVVTVHSAPGYCNLVEELPNFVVTTMLVVTMVWFCSR